MAHMQNSPPRFDKITTKLRRPKFICIIYKLYKPARIAAKFGEIPITDKQTQNTYANKRTYLHILDIYTCPTA